MKKILKLIAFILIFSMVLVPGQLPVYADSADGAVEISKENFPDPVFRHFILNGSHTIWDEQGNPIEVVYDANKDGWLSVEEADNIKQLLVMESYIRDLKGMENLTKLIEVDCQRSSVEKLYLENCADLQILNCYRAQLKGTLDLSKNAKLEGASCHNNRELTGINISGCENLYSLTCGATGVSELDLSNTPKLKFISCEDTPVTELDFSSNPELTSVCAYNSALEYIDVSKNEKLEMLDVSTCKLISLDLRNNPALYDLNVYGNNFAWFELGEKPQLDVELDKSTIDMEVSDGSFDITEVFPGIDPAKVSIVSGASIDGNIVSGYTEGIPVTYNYDCGTYEKGNLILNVTLNIKGYAEPVVPDDESDTVVPENDGAANDKNDSSPETGDDFTVYPWIAIMLIACGIMAYTVSARKREF